MMKLVSSKNKSIKTISVVLVLMMLMTSFYLPDVNAATVSIGSASGNVNSSNGAYLRSSASTSSKKVDGLKNNEKLYLKSECFTSSKKYSSKYKWYEATEDGKNGYIRSDLVDGIKYQSVTGKIKSTVTCRRGPSTKMKSGGKIKKGKKVSVVMKARRKGSSEQWYKIKKGSSYYYVMAKRLTLYPKTTTITTTSVSTPSTMTEGDSFNVRGTVSANKDIERVEVAVLNSSGKNSISSQARPNVTSYNLSGLDKNLKFGALKQGSYRYRVIVTVDGKAYTKVDKAFTIKEPSTGGKIANKALELAWPEGTASSKYSYNGGSPTSAYAAALDSVYPDHNKWNAGSNTGASCDVFVGTVVRATGYDMDFPRGLDQQWPYMEKSSKWKEVANFDRNVSSLKNGDIIIYRKSSGSGRHVFIYYNTNGNAGYAEASLKSKYGIAIAGTSAVQKKLSKSNITKIAVFRAVK